MNLSSIGLIVLLIPAVAAAAEARVCVEPERPDVGGRHGLAALEILATPGLMAQDGDDKGDVLVGFTSQHETFRWSRRGGAAILGAGYGPSTSVSKDGLLVAGSVVDTTDPLRRRHAAIWTRKDGWRWLAPGYTEGSQAGRLSDDGRFVVGTASGKFLQPIPFLWSDRAEVVELTLPPDSPGGEASAVGDRGDVVVGSAWHPFEGGGWSPRGLRWVEGAPAWLTDHDGEPVGRAINCNADCSVVVGGGTIFPYTEKSRRAYRWTEQEGVEYLPPLANEPPDAPVPPGISYAAQDVTNDGRTVIGIYQYFDMEQLTFVLKGFLWTEENGTHDFSEFLASRGLDGLNPWRDVVPSDVSRDGRRIVGWGRDEAGVGRSFVVTLRRPCTP